MLSLFASSYVTSPTGSDENPACQLTAAIESMMECRMLLFSRLPSRYGLLLCSEIWMNVNGGSLPRRIGALGDQFTLRLVSVPDRTSDRKIFVQSPVARAT